MLTNVLYQGWTKCHLSLDKFSLCFLVPATQTDQSGCEFHCSYSPGKELWRNPNCEFCLCALRIIKADLVWLHLSMVIYGMILIKKSSHQSSSATKENFQQRIWCVIALLSICNLKIATLLFFKLHGPRSMSKFTFFERWFMFKPMTITTNCSLPLQGDYARNRWAQYLPLLILHIHSEG